MMPQMSDDGIMSPLYSQRCRDYSTIKKEVGQQMWQKAKLYAERVNAVLAWRKKEHLFALNGFAGAIDACIIAKPDRLVLNPTSNALFNHGMPVIQRDTNGRYKILILPESRIEARFPNAQKVVLTPNEVFGVSEHPYTFYYEVQNEKH
jgi:hypothetical protein